MLRNAVHDLQAIPLNNLVDILLQAVYHKAEQGIG
jgi:hypothetical protein